jgi:hypothetical protein
LFASFEYRAKRAVRHFSRYIVVFAPLPLQLQLRYLTKEFLSVLNVSSGEKLFAKFSTRRKILC